MPATEVPFELSVLAEAVNYQRWVYSSVEPLLGRRILEVGAGTGNMSRWLPVRDRLVLTEADPALLRLLREKVDLSDPRVEARGFDLAKDDEAALVAERFDTIVSFNVLEHVEDDAAALAKLRRVVLGGDPSRPRRIVTFVPAQQWAFGELDEAFGHFRRYSGARWRELRQRVAPEAKLSLRHFNAPGLAGWFVNGRLLRRRTIDDRTVRLFERLCPVVRPLDELLHRVLRLPTGQSIIATLEWPALSGSR